MACLTSYDIIIHNVYIYIYINKYKYIYIHYITNYIWPYFGGGNPPNYPAEFFAGLDIKLIMGIQLATRSMRITMGSTNTSDVDYSVEDSTRERFKT